MSINFSEVSNYYKTYKNILSHYFPALIIKIKKPSKFSVTLKVVKISIKGKVLFILNLNIPAPREYYKNYFNFKIKIK